MIAMHASTLCRRELGLLEGTVLHWYPDATRTMTCCTGHTNAAGAPLYPPARTFTAVEADAILAADLSKVYEPEISRLVKVPISTNEADALILIGYNIGAGNLAKSSLLTCLNRGDKAGAAEGFSHFTTSHGRQLDGLVKRRAIERQIFLTGTYPGLKPDPGHSGAEMAAAVTLGQGASGDAVRHLQADLKALGFLPHSPDGVFGPLTKHAVQAFQRAHGLSDDGVAGLKTGMAIEAALRPPAPIAPAKTSPVVPIPLAQPRAVSSALLPWPERWRIFLTGRLAA